MDSRKGTMKIRTPRWTAGRVAADLADPYLYTDETHLEMWRQARAAHPVAWTESELAGGFWSVVTHAEGSEVIRRPTSFVSVQGMRLQANPAGVRAAAGRMLVVSDGAEHRRLRGVHQAWFNARSVAALVPTLGARVEERLDALLARGTTFDAIAELTAEVPRWALFDLLGVPDEDQDELARTMEEAFDDSDPGPAGEAARTAAHTRIFGHFGDLLDLRREEPGDDIVSALAQAAPDGVPLTDDEILLNCDGLMNGGLETTSHALAGALLVFARRPDVWRRLREDPGLIDTAVEEILRWTSPALHALRTAAEDTVLGDVRIAAGDRVAVWYPSCNRDEKVFADPDTFRLDRRPNPHIAFGGGPHYCVGATLTRLEVKCVLAAAVERVAEIEVEGEAVRRPSNFLQGLSHLRIGLTADRRPGPRSGPGPRSDPEPRPDPEPLPDPLDGASTNGTSSDLRIVLPGADTATGTGTVEVRSNQEVTFGRGLTGAPADISVDDPTGEPIAGRIRAAEDGLWFITNLSRARTYVVENEEGGGEYVCVPPGRLDMPVPFPHARISLPSSTGSTYLSVSAPTPANAYAATTYAPDADPAARPDPAFALDPRAKYFLVLVALCEPQLRAPATMAIPSTAEIVRRLSPLASCRRISPAAVNFHIEYIAGNKLGVRNQQSPSGRSGGNWLRQAVVSTALRFRLVWTEHLALLPAVEAR
ncbi:putative cytochrome P450 hydroxylase [Streptomyces formicae]|uniref:Putative cytochrome P450 hydroxylase n=2 Tax=Streptomyces formicae TaxID=1616117 RepID=A0A291Q0P5_9ACTN|nr:putative cytochrome P450 hydroxylase [Streptomyces formicae]